jgi:hypothetical protein
MITDPASPIAADMLKAVCNAGERCSCADKNYQWYSHQCGEYIRICNAIAMRLFGTMGIMQRMTSEKAEELTKRAT